MSDKDTKNIQGLDIKAESGNNEPIPEKTFEFDRHQLQQGIYTNKLSIGSLLAKQNKPIFLDIEGKKIELPNQAAVILGRSVSETPETPVEQPDVALNEFGATEKGVSRHHARVSRYSNLICISDMGSINGTFVNAQRLNKNDTRILHNGDEVQLGFLKLKVEF